MKTLQEIVDKGQRIVFFGGAGVSTESGIPDFRSADGLYNQKYAYPPEVILSDRFFYSKPEEFFKFYREKMIFPNAKPNAAHRKLSVRFCFESVDSKPMGFCAPVMTIGFRLFCIR